MVVSNIIQYFFYEDEPACIILGVEISDNVICEEIIKSIELVFYTIFIVATLMMGIRTLKMIYTFCKVLQYLFIVKIFDDDQYSWNKKLLFLLRYIQSYQDNLFTFWKSSSKECNFTCRNNLADCKACHNCVSTIARKKCDTYMNNLYKSVFGSIVSKKSNKRHNKVERDLELIFLNKKYNPSKTTTESRSLQPVQPAVSVQAATGFDMAMNHHKNYSDGPGKENDIEDATVKETTKFEVDSYNGQVASDMNDCGYKAFQCDPTTQIVAKCRKNYAQKMATLSPYFPKYPLWILQKNFMRVIYNNNIQMVAAKELPSKKFDSSLPQRVSIGPVKKIQTNIRVTPIRNALSTEKKSVMFSKIDNKKKEMEINVKRNVTPVLPRNSDILRSKNPVVRNTSPMYKGLESQYASLVRNAITLYRKNQSLKAIDRYQSNHSLNKYGDKRKLPISRTNFSQNSNDARVNGESASEKGKLSNNICPAPHLSRTNKQYDSNKSVRNDHKETKKSNDENDFDVKKEIVNTLVNMPNETILKMKTRYNMHKSNKVKVASSTGNNLDIIPESVSKTLFDVDGNNARK